MEAVKRLHASGLLHGEWKPTAEAAAQVAYHMRAAAAVELDLRALYDADDRAAAMEKSRSSSPDATPGTTLGAISSSSRKQVTVTQINNTTGVLETLHVRTSSTPYLKRRIMLCLNELAFTNAMSSL